MINYPYEKLTVSCLSTDSSMNDGKSDGIVSTEIVEETISDTIDKVTDDVIFNKASWKGTIIVII